MAPGQYATVWWQTWQRVTGRRVTVTGKRRESGDLLICFRHATPSGVISPVHSVMLPHRRIRMNLHGTSNNLPVNRRSVIAGKRPGLSLASARAACIKACQD